MNRVKLFFAIIVVGSCLFAFQSCEDGVKIPSIYDRVYATKITDSTPAGILIRTEPGVIVPLEVKLALDRGLTTTFAKIQCKYGRSNKPSDYMIAVVKGELYNGNPVYRLPCNSYCGGDYDKGGYIYAAGQMISVGSPNGNIIAIPEQYGNITNAEIIAEYEGEHPELAYWDGDEYERTKFHGSGIGHPIVPYCPISEGRRSLTGPQVFFPTHEGLLVK